MLKQRALASTVLTATSLAIFGAAASNAQVEVITVTATKVEESAQDIPVAVQALGEQQLEEYNISNFDDYVRYLPNVNFGGRGPGQNSIYIRGMTTSTIAVQLAQANGTAPNVALYLDEQPVAVNGRNLDVYATDMERIEVLPGPQGTLYGASALAGAVRLISNKPEFEFEAGLDAYVETTEGGEPSHGVEAVINLPVTDKFAVRGAFYSINQGGYIDNTYGTFTPDRDVINANSPGGPVLPADTTFETVNNADLVEADFNDSSYNGFRVSGLYEFNADWSALVQHTSQVLEADGVFDYDPEVGDLEVNRFAPDTLEDEFSQTSWTIEGRYKMLDLIYTGGYLDRQVNQSIDYTGYNNEGGYISYYLCDYGTPRTCYDPTKQFIGQVDNERITHEFRVSTPRDNRWRVLGGVFYEEIETLDQGNFLYYSILDTDFPAQNFPLPNTTTINPNPRNAPVAFFNDITKNEEQLAFFGNFEFDVFPDVLTASIGFRNYNYEVDVVGSANSHFGNLGSDEDNQLFGDDLDAKFADIRPLKEDDTMFRYNLSWTPTSNTLFYATISEGYRPPMFNRGGGQGNATTTVPFTVKSDEIKNYELGWKTTLLDGDMVFNGSAYMIDWSDIQVAVFDPSVYFLFYVDNAADAEIKGVEADLTYQPDAQWTFNAAVSYNDTEITDRRSAATVSVAEPGSELALSPELQFTARVRYAFDLAGYDSYVQGGLQYASESYSSIVVQPQDRYEQDAYTLLEASWGVSKDNWNAELYVDNLTDERTEYFINTQDGFRRITTERPRTFGVRVSVDFE